RCPRLAAVPRDGFQDRPRATVMQIMRGAAADSLGETEAPERWRTPLGGVCGAFRPTVSEAWPHIVQQQVGIGPDKLEGLLRIGVAAGDVFGDMAADATRFVEQALANQ